MQPVASGGFEKENSRGILPGSSMMPRVHSQTQLISKQQFNNLRQAQTPSYASTIEFSGSQRRNHENSNPILVPLNKVITNPYINREMKLY